MSDIILTPEFVQLKEKWYNNRQRALEDLAGLKTTDFADVNLFIAEFMRFQAEAKVWKDAVDDLELYFKPDAIQKDKQGEK